MADFISLPTDMVSFVTIILRTTGLVVICYALFQFFSHKVSTPARDDIIDNLIKPPKQIWGSIDWSKVKPSNGDGHKGEVIKGKFRKSEAPFVFPEEGI